MSQGKKEKNYGKRVEREGEESMLGRKPVLSICSCIVLLPGSRMQRMYDPTERAIFDPLSLSLSLLLDFSLSRSRFFSLLKNILF